MTVPCSSKWLVCLLSVIAVIAGAVAPAGAGSDEYGGGSDVAVDLSTSIDHVRQPSTRSEARSVAMVEGVTGDELVGVEFVRGLDAFAIALDDRIELVDRGGAKVATIDLAGVVAMSVSSFDLFAATESGQIHRIYRDGNSHAIETWQVADGPIRTLSARSSLIVFVTEANPSSIGSLNTHSGEIDPDFIGLDEPINVIDFSSSKVHASSDSNLYVVLIRSFEPFVEVHSVHSIPGVTDMVTDTYGMRAWLASSLPHVTEVGWNEGGIIDHVLQPAAQVRSAAGNYANDRIGFATAGDELFDIRIHDLHILDGASTDAISLIALDPGLEVVPNGLALGRYRFAAVVSDPACDCLRVIVQQIGPSLDDPLARPTIEAGPDASITVYGQSFATVDRVFKLHSVQPVPAVIAPDGRSITVDLSGFEVGHTGLELWGPAGWTDARFEIIEAIPEPEPVDFTTTACPWITDSVQRLYSAYFLRASDQSGFEFWLDAYSTGEWSLPRASAFFSQSPEFIEMYGAVSDVEFIDLIYGNIFGRQADEGGRTYWLGRMEDEGLDRGTVMLYFSESPEYIAQTGTETPMAGHFNWYPEGTTWGCGFGPMSAQLPADATWVDVGFWNVSNRTSTVVINEYIGGKWVEAHRSDLEPDHLRTFFGVERPSNVTDISLSSTQDTAWTLVISPSATPSTRAGWGS